MSSVVTLTAAQENWLAASAALAFDPSQINRDREAFTRKALGNCECGKPATHLLADEASDEWACRVPGCDVSFTRCELPVVARYEVEFYGRPHVVTRCAAHAE